jgi:hypothetical protein
MHTFFDGDDKFVVRFSHTTNTYIMAEIIGDICDDREEFPQRLTLCTIERNGQLVGVAEAACAKADRFVKAYGRALSFWRASANLGETTQAWLRSLLFGNGFTVLDRHLCEPKLTDFYTPSLTDRWKMLVASFSIGSSDLDERTLTLMYKAWFQGLWRVGRFDAKDRRLMKRYFIEDMEQMLLEERNGV